MKRSSKESQANLFALAESQGGYSHQTVLSLHDLTDLMPSKLHMTVPMKFRRMVETPSILELHFADLSPSEIEEREGYRMTRPIRAIADVSRDVPADLIVEAFSKARIQGLITERDLKLHRKNLPAFLFPDGTSRPKSRPHDPPPRSGRARLRDARTKPHSIHRLHRLTWMNSKNL